MRFVVKNDLGALVVLSLKNVQLGRFLDLGFDVIAQAHVGPDQHDVTDNQSREGDVEHFLVHVFSTMVIIGTDEPCRSSVQAVFSVAPAGAFSSAGKIGRYLVAKRNTTKPMNTRN